MSSLTKRRLQLLARGYRIIPTYGKKALIPGWNTPDFAQRELTPARVETWPSRWPDLMSTGVRIENGLRAVDIDVDDGPMVEALLRYVATIAPDVHARAPTRYGGGEHKLTLFVRAPEGDATGAGFTSARYVRPGDDAEDSQKVELFFGGPANNGNCARHCGIYGPHSYNDDGSVAREYCWAEGVPALHEVDTGALPLMTKAQMLELAGEFERLAEAAGWAKVRGPDQAGASVAYDIDDDTRFDTNRGGTGISYAELCEAYAAYGDGLRVSANFMPGRGDSGSRERCLVGDDNRHQCVAVWVPSDEALHFPKDLAPGATIDELGATLLAAGLKPKVDPVWRECYVSGFPKASLHNAILAVEAIGAQCCKDTFHDRLIMDGAQVTDVGIRALRVKLSNRFGLDFTETHLSDAVSVLCEANAFDPVVDMLAEAEANWDGVARLDQMGPLYFQTEDTPLARQCVRKTMIAAVARARQPGVKFDTILTMESPEGLNKSSAWAVLAGAGNFSDERVIGKDSREVQEILRGVWIHESSDLAGLTKAEVETVKAFASRTSDRARPAYGRHLVDQPRHSIEVATTNDEAYLLSQTGNRRFWPVKVNGAIDLLRLRTDRLQLWGEAAHYQSEGESLVLDEALWPVAGIEQEARRVRHPWEDILRKMARIPTVGPMAGIGASEHRVIHRELDEERVASSAIFEHVLKVPNGQLHNGHSKTLASVMRVIGWTHCTFWADGGAVKGYKRTVLTDITGKEGVSIDPIVILYPQREPPGV